MPHQQSKILGKYGGYLTEGSPWPLNPNHPKPFKFPQLGSQDWVNLSIGQSIPTNRSEAGDLDWKATWKRVYYGNYRGRTARILNWHRSGKLRAPNLIDYFPHDPGEWAETVLQELQLRSDVNAFSLDCLIRELNELGEPLWNPDRAKWRCERFHSYQRARHRYHEYLAEKLCLQAISSRKEPKARDPFHMRAAMIGWLSRQRGFSKHRLVDGARQFFDTKRFQRENRQKERTCFDRERELQKSKRKPWRADPNIIGWLILTWPIWDCYKWSYPVLQRVIYLKFTEINRKPTRRFVRDRSRVLAEICHRISETDGLPVADFDNLISQLFPDTADLNRPTHSENVKKLVRTIGLPLSPHPKGRPSAVDAQKLPPCFSAATDVSA